MRNLTIEEVNVTSGGDIDWDTVAAGATILALGIAVVATAGMATVPIAVMGAATAGEIMVAGVGVTAAAAGGAAIGDGLTD